MIRLFTLAFLLAVLPSNLKAQDCVSNPVSVFGDLSVSGTKIVDQNNNVVSLAGNSFFWSNTGFGAEKFYNSNVVDWLQEDWGSTIVRAAMGVDEFGGFLSDRQGNQQRVETIVDAAIANNMYVIIDWHSHHAEEYRGQAISFFEDMARKYGDRPNVIYEIYNEPITRDWSNTIKPYSEAVIAAIRAIDPDNLIIVGTGFYSQDVDIASNNPIRGYDNLVYALHFYAGTHGNGLRQRARTAMNNGIALIVSEWGTVNADGNGGVAQDSTEQWMSFLRENDISHLNWSVHDKNEGASIVRPGANVRGGWSDGDLTMSGLVVRDIIEGWHDCAGEPAGPSPVQPQPQPQPDNGGNLGNDSLAYPNGIAHSIPGVINATQYDTGGSGVSYSDTDNGNNGSGPRQGESVDTENRSSGGNVGWIRSGEWLEFTVDVQTAGRYRVAFEVAARRDVGSQLHLEFEGQNVTGTVRAPSTGDWGNFTTVVAEDVQLNSGQQTMRISFDRGGFNLANVAFELDGGTNSPAPAPQPEPTPAPEPEPTPAPEPEPTPAPAPEPEPTPAPEPEPAPMPAPGFDDCLAVSMPYARNGEGSVCLEVSGNINFINSWNMDSVTINGVDFTNKYSRSLPDPIDGSYFIEYEASVPWAHFEINGSDN